MLCKKLKVLWGRQTQKGIVAIQMDSGMEAQHGVFRAGLWRKWE